VRGDESLVIVYDERDSSPEAVAAAVAGGAEDTLPNASVLRQRVE
jgi:tRNA C32,U32 (ribose-2'-O)-methylase TrmJ